MTFCRPNLAFFICYGLLLGILNDITVLTCILVPATFVLCGGENKSESSDSGQTPTRGESSNGSQKDPSGDPEEEEDELSQELSSLVKQHLRISKDIRDIKQELEN